MLPVCPVCGAAHATCGGPSANQPVDVPLTLEPKTGRTTMAKLQHYKDEKGRVFSMTAEHAAKVGFTLVEDDGEKAGGQSVDQTAESNNADAKAQDAPAENKAVSGPVSTKSARKS